MEGTGLNRMNRPNPLLYSLLKVALHCPYSEGEVISQLSSLSEEEWDLLFSQSREQAVSGLLYHSFEILQSEDLLPDSIAMAWMLNAYQIQERGESVGNLARQLCSAMEDKGLHPIILKGPAVAAYYPCPEMRTSGDIDLYFSQQEFQAARSFLTTCYGQEKMASDGSFHYQVKGIDIDLHSRFYDSSIAVSLLPSPPSAEATLFMLSSHILKHALGPGVGLRQICDLAMAARALKVDYDAETLLKTFRDTRTFRWNQMLFSLIRERLWVDAGLFPSGEDTSFASLEKIIFTGGNFGQHSSSRKKALGFSDSRRKMDTAVCMLQRLPFALRYAPREYVFYFTSLLKGNLESNNHNVPYYSNP